jgi:copper chaperone CopZ
MKTVTYQIPNISCGHCVNTIKMEVDDIEGIKSVAVSEDNKTATITFEAPATDEKIRALLAEINYPAVE